MNTVVTTQGIPKTWTIQKTMNWGYDFLSRTFLESPDIDAKVILSELLGISPGQLFLKYPETISHDTLRTYQGMVKRRSQFEPVAYIVGKKNFLGFDFNVDKRVLIPRPETELLVETCNELIQKYELLAPKILEIGTGSGCIAISLAKFNPNSSILATDISKDALDVASQNAVLAKVNEQISFVQNDLFNGFSRDYKGYFDIIISNPPYVPTSDWGSLSPDVLYEPRQALVGGPDGLFFINRIIRQGVPFLQPKGIILLELGIGQGGKAKQLMESQSYFKVDIRKDYSGIERIIHGMKNGST